MRHAFFRSIRTHLILLVLISLLPALGIIIYGGLDRQRRDMEDSRNQSVRVLTDLAHDHTRTMEGARIFLVTLSKLQEVRNKNVSDSVRLFRELRTQNPIYANIFAASANGTIYASALPFIRYGIGHRKYFRDAVRTKDFSVGEYVWGPTLQKPIIHFAYPVLNPKREVTGIVAVTIDLAHYDRIFQQTSLPRDFVLGITDHRHIYLYRFPDPKRYAGMKEPSDMTLFMAGPPEAGAFTSTDRSGIKWFYVYRKLSLDRSSTPYLYMTVGIPEKKALAGSTRTFWITLAFLCAALLVALLSAWLVGNMLVTRRLQGLLKAFQRLGSGDLTARAGLNHDRSEMGQLAAAFDEMAGALVGREGEKRIAMEELQASEKRYRTLFDEAIEGIVLADQEHGIIQDCNRSFLRLTGYARSELVGRFETMLHPPEPGQLSRIFSLQRVEKEGQVLIDRILTKEGNVKEVEIKANTIVMGGVRHMQCFFRDITREQRIHREKETTLMVLNLLNDHSEIRELIRKITAFLLEWTGCEATGVRLRDGDDFPYYETRGFHKEFLAAENSLCVKDLNGQIIRDDAGSPVLECMCGNILSCRFDPALPFFTARGSFWSNCTTDLLATTTDEDRQTRTRNRCNGEGYESVALIPLRHGNLILGLLQFNDRRKGRFTPELISFLESTGEQIAIALAQRQAQVALRKSEQRFRDISEAAGEYLFEFDPYWRFTFVSDRIRDVLEYSPHEVRGKIVFELLPEPMVPKARDLFESLKRDRVGFSGVEFPVLTKTGRAVWMSATAVPIFDGNRDILGYRGAAMDITSRKEAEETIKGSLREKEVLLREIHHRVKNNLQVVSSLLNMQSRYIRDSEDSACFSASMDRIRSMALIHDKLYRSRNLAHIYFPDYVNDLSRDLLLAYALGRDMEMNIDVAPLSLDIDTAMPLGLIINELLSNSLKHAFPNGNSGAICLNLSAGERENTLVVSDNGIGFPPGIDFTRTQSLGMQLVMTLVDQLEGSIELRSEGGTEVRITFGSA
ncbi:MAG TPA: PAS domain S-box protein [Syntrophorhabdaceae bacterium]|jgi:PAS domain S-box-containing protein